MACDSSGLLHMAWWMDALRVDLRKRRPRVIAYRGNRHTGTVRKYIRLLEPLSVRVSAPSFSTLKNEHATRGKGCLGHFSGIPIWMGILRAGICYP